MWLPAVSYSSDISHCCLIMALSVNAAVGCFIIIVFDIGKLAVVEELAFVEELVISNRWWCYRRWSDYGVWWTG